MGNGTKDFIAYASNSNPSGRDSVKKTSDGNTEGDANAQGPPFLTIVAGFVVFSLFLLQWWMVMRIGELRLIEVDFILMSVRENVLRCSEEVRTYSSSLESR